MSRVQVLLLYITLKRTIKIVQQNIKKSSKNPKKKH